MVVTSIVLLLVPSPTFSLETEVNFLPNGSPVVRLKIQVTIILCLLYAFLNRRVDNSLWK